MTRHITIFSLRYATVVLDRYAKFWGAVGATCRISSLLAGSGAIAALGAESQWAAAAFGVAFALAQAIEFAVHPASKAAHASEMARRYSSVWANESRLDDASLDLAYREIVATDGITVFQSLKDLAYNQVLQEMNCPMDDAYQEGRMHRLVGLIC